MGTVDMAADSQNERVGGERGSLLFVIRLVVFVELETLAGVVAVRLFIVVRFQRLFLQLDCFVEIADFGVGCSEGAETSRFLPVR